MVYEKRIILGVFIIDELQTLYATLIRNIHPVIRIKSFVQQTDRPKQNLTYQIMIFKKVSC